MKQIYVVEDDENIRNLIKVALQGYGYQVRDYEAAEQALSAMEEQVPELAIFDLMLPGIDGLEAILRIRSRKEWKDLPVIVLTARDKEYDKVKGLDHGADDYITKPFSVMELAARVRALLRRSEKALEREEKNIGTADLVIDKALREVKLYGEPVRLTYKEYELLVLLVENKDRVVLREEILNQIWGYSAEIETRTLDIHIRSLRQKLGGQGNSGIKTVRSVGYRFVAE